MLRTRLIILCLFSVIVGAMCIVPARSEPGKPADRWKINELRVKMFSQGSGELEDVNLAEVISSSANAPLHPLLLIVEITGNPDPTSGHKIQLTAKEGNKLVFNQTNATSFETNGDKFYVPFWIYGYRCEPLLITARVVGQRPASIITKTIKFSCGE